MDITNELRSKCGHNSYDVDGCASCEAATLIESLRQQLAECQAALIEAHELIRLRRNVFVSETYNERCEKALAATPEQSIAEYASPLGNGGVD